MCMHVCRYTQIVWNTKNTDMYEKPQAETRGDTYSAGSDGPPSSQSLDYLQGPNRVWICDKQVSQSGATEDSSLLESYVMWTNKQLLLFQMITVPPTAWSSSPRSHFSWTASLQSLRTWVIIYQLTKCHIAEDGNLQQ